MIGYIIGTITQIDNDKVIVENNGIGYIVYFFNVGKLSLNNQYKIYTHQVVKEDDISLFGFLALEEKSLFLSLTNVKGIGAKTANNIMGRASVRRLVDAIDSGDLAFLKTLPGIGSKSAQQIILDLKGKLVAEEKSNSVNENIEDALMALKGLGYKASEIKSIENELAKHKNKDVDEYVKIALQLMMKRKGG